MNTKALRISLLWRLSISDIKFVSWCTSLFQDTVVALQALAEYSALIFGGTTNIKVTVILSPPCEIFELSITHENRLVLQEQEIEVFPSFVQIAATGEGCALVKVRQGKGHLHFKIQKLITTYCTSGFDKICILCLVRQVGN